ncbi:MAG: PEP-CTERM sorting domain-containing protein [Pseudomonadota bacterium]
MMKSLLTATVLICVAATAQAVTYKTRITYTPLPGSEIVDPTIIIDWATDETMGVIDVTDISALSVSIFNGNTLIFTDEVVVNGMLQPLLGVARNAFDPDDGTGDVIFDVDLDDLNNGGIQTLFSDVNTVGGNVGVRYQFFYQPGIVGASRYENGVEVAFNTDDATGSVQITTAPVPLPGTLPLLGAGLGLATIWRRQSNVA